MPPANQKDAFWRWKIKGDPLMLDRKQVERLLAANSLGLLNPSEARQLEDYLEKADDELLQKSDDYCQVVGMLGLDASAEQPPTALKSQVMARVKAAPDNPLQAVEASEAFYFIRTTQEPWQEIFPGITLIKLHQDESNDVMTALVRMAPGSRLPGHRHMGEEEVYMIEGQGEMDGTLYHAGDYLYSKGDSVHGETYTTDGCLLFCRLPAIEFFA